MHYAYTVNIHKICKLIFRNFIYQKMTSKYLSDHIRYTYGICVEVHLLSTRALYCTFGSNLLVENCSNKNHRISEESLASVRI